MAATQIEMELPPSIDEIVDIWRKDGFIDLHFYNGKWRLIRQKPSNFKPPFYFEAHIIGDDTRVAGLTLPKPKKNEKLVASAMLALMRAALTLTPGSREQALWLARATADIATIIYKTKLEVQTGARESENPMTWILIRPR